MERPSARDSAMRLEYWVDQTLSEKLDCHSELSRRFRNTRHKQTRQRWRMPTHPWSERAPLGFLLGACSFAFVRSRNAFVQVVNVSLIR